MVVPTESGSNGGGAVLPVLSSPLHNSSSQSRPTDPVTPKVSVLVQGRIDGPVERYRVASRALCRIVSVLGWASVVIGAGEIVVGILVFSKLRREGAWWVGLLGAFLGMAATGINADTPLGTPVVMWMLCLSLVSLVSSLVALLALDGARWMDTKDVEDCVNSFGVVCDGFDCACSTDGGLWDKCFPQGNGDCGEIKTMPPLLLVSSVALLALALISALLLITAIKVKFFWGGMYLGGVRARHNGDGTPPKASYMVPATPARGQNGNNNDGHHGDDESRRQQRRRQQQLEACVEAGESVGARYVEEWKEDVKPSKEVLTGAEPWAVGYVDRVAGGGNKKRRDEFNSVGRSSTSSGGGSVSGNGMSSAIGVSQ